MLLFRVDLCEHEVPARLMKLSDEDNASFLATVKELEVAEVCTYMFVFCNYTHMCICMHPRSELRWHNFDYYTIIWTR